MSAKHLRFRVFILVSAIAIPFPTAAATIRVPADYETIQRGIDAAEPGDTVLVEPGTYTERIQLKPQVTLRSTGDDSQGTLGLRRAEVTIIDGGGKHDTGAGVAMAESATLDGFTVTNVGLYDDARWQQHNDTQGEQQSHERIGQAGTPGVAVVGVACAVQNNIMHHNGHTGIELQGVEGKQGSPHIYRNLCYRNMGGGIGALQKSTAVIEENVCFQNFYAGIGQHAANSTVIRNTCYENIRAGIGISSGACPIVRGNQCYRNRRAGVGTRGGANTRPVIADNVCYENDMAGIGAAEQSSPLVCNNRCHNNKAAGIGARDNAAPRIVSNECYENEQAGIGLASGAELFLVGNHCHHNQTAGIGFAPGRSGRSTVMNNRVLDNARVAVGIHAGWTVRLSGNELSRTGGVPPLVMVFADADATLSDNVFRGGGVAGVRVAGKVQIDNNEFVGTSFRAAGPPNFAVWALPGSIVTMTGNRIRGWRHGLHASAASVVAIDNTVREFGDTALVIVDAGVPAHIFGNTAISSGSQVKVLSLSGKRGVVENNDLAAPNE